MEIGAAEYFFAARQNLEAALLAHEADLYVASHYLAGVAVESILRAYRWQINEEWDGRHFLARLLRESRLLSRVPTAASESFEEHFYELSRRWSNEHRYASDAKLLKYLNSIGAGRNFKGDKLRENSRIMTNAANFIVALGAKKWV